VTSGGSQITHKIIASRVVFATGYESQLALSRKLVQLKSTYAVATAPIPNLDPLLRELCIWESARPYIYFRTASDPAGSRIILGGGDEDFYDTQRRDRLIASKAKTLQHRLTE